MKLLLREAGRAGWEQGGRSDSREFQRREWTLGWGQEERGDPQGCSHGIPAEESSGWRLWDQSRSQSRGRLSLFFPWSIPASLDAIKAWSDQTHPDPMESHPSRVRRVRDSPGGADPAPWIPGSRSCRSMAGMPLEFHKDTRSRWQGAARGSALFQLPLPEKFQAWNRWPQLRAKSREAPAVKKKPGKEQIQAFQARIQRLQPRRARGTTSSIPKKAVDRCGCQGVIRNPKENVRLPWQLPGTAPGLPQPSPGTERIRGMEANPSGSAGKGSESWGGGWSSAVFMEFRGLSASLGSQRGIFRRDVDPEHPPLRPPGGKTLPDSRQIPLAA